VVHQEYWALWIEGRGEGAPPPHVLVAGERTASRVASRNNEALLEQNLGPVGNKPWPKSAKRTSGGPGGDYKLYEQRLPMKGSKGVGRREIFEYIEVYYNNWTFEPHRPGRGLSDSGAQL